ncbi:CotH kinase family protein [[Clostridium] symbiosum]|uniref:CotH kinase family protein n=1 Tax=Clostridium symbiosum TaxID=1512 RepID=UPI00257092C3|nr:CotH kinase family protein [[Clostridium] symbiosum]
MGLYGMYEKIEQGEGRVEIEKDTGYLLLRDRIDTEGLSMPVWSTKHQRSNNWVNLEYPSPDKVSKEYWDYIRNDVNKIEDSLYSDDKKKFEEYKSKLNVGSFVDYFIINEFFANYDAGWNSTFMYKNRSGKLFIGPYWDFDGALDNYTKEMLEVRETALPNAPWFDSLLRDEDFVNKVVERYGELRKNILSEGKLYDKIDKAASFIEKPVKRDLSRWSALYSNPMQLNEEKGTGIIVDRETSTWEKEIERLKDVMRLHGDFLDSDITQLYRFVQFGRDETPNTMLGVYFIIAFFVSIILVQRAREGIR